MPVAMTAPLLAPLVQHARRSSLTERKARAVGLALVGHFAVWAVAAAALALAATAILALAGTPAAATGLVVAAGLVWQGAPQKRLMLNAGCRLRPLPACGARADRAALALGARSAAACALSCWALMLAPMTAGPAHLIVMAAAATLMLGERYGRPVAAVARWGWIGAGLALAAAGTASAAWLA